MIPTEPIDAESVRHAARIAGLEISEQHLPAVVLNLRRLAQFARTLEECALAPDEEPANMFRP